MSAFTRAPVAAMMCFYKGGYNRFLSRRDLEGGSYVHLLETLSRLRKDRVDDNERAA